ncbi:hypothetical protein KCU95_g3399, partial [Aureobasidium melanogenum]
MYFNQGILTLLPLLLVSQVQAQSSSQNLTLGFSANDGKGLVNFSTSVTPASITCFNLADVFASNASSEQSYTVSNAQDFSSQANYTSLFYQQLNESINGDGSGIGTGKDAARVVEVFPGEDCREIDGLAWFGFSCQNADGELYVIPGGVKSFSIVSKAESVNKGKCWVHAEYGGTGSTIFKGCFVAVMAAAFSGLLLAI